MSPMEHSGPTLPSSSVINSDLPAEENRTHICLLHFCLPSKFVYEINRHHLGLADGILYAADVWKLLMQLQRCPLNSGFQQGLRSESKQVQHCTGMRGP